MTNLDRDNLHRLLTDHIARYPRMQVQDLYKLLLQSAMGCEHVVGDERKARSWLEREVANTVTGPDDPLIDPISPDGCLVRLHLRPYFHAGRDLERLLEAFVQTSKQPRGSPEKLREFGGQAARMAKEGLLPFSAEDILAYWSDRERHGYRAVHHSYTYQKLYHPAYRVVARQFLEEG